MSGYPPYIIPGAFKETVCRQIAVQIERDTLTINVAGFDGLVAPLGENSLNAWDTEMRLAVGNEQTGDRPWLGEIRTLIAGTSSRRIDYLASTDLEIPKLWWRIPGRIQRLEEAGPWITNPLDATLNFLGFFPIPVIILVLAGARLRTTTLLSIAFSITVSIEVGQLFVVGRQPSLSDVGMNFGGAATALGLMYLTNIYSQIQPPE